MDFGKNILTKFGWKEGQGLGKDQQGMLKPIRAVSNHENKGLGHNQGAEFNNHWWERIYNESSTNLNVSKSSPGEVSFDLKDPDGVEISAKSYSVKKLKDKNVKMTYGSFLKSATLLADVCKEEAVTGHVQTEDIEFDYSRIMADEDLFKACGGRTAHKGARHGLNLTGKLSRVEEQDALLLEKLRNSGSYSGIFSDKDFRPVRLSKSKQGMLRKKLVDPDLHPEEEVDELSEILNNNNQPPLSTKKKKKSRQLDNDLSENIYSMLQSEEMASKESEPEPSTSSGKKKKGKKNKESTAYELKTTIKKKSKKSRKAKNRNHLVQTTVTAQQALSYLKDNLITAKQLKKMKHKNRIIPEPEAEPEKVSRKRKRVKCDSDTDTDSNAEDLVEKINQEQQLIREVERKEGKLKRAGPSNEFESEHFDRVSKKTKNGNKKKAKRKDKRVHQLADTLKEVLSTQNSGDEDL